MLEALFSAIVETVFVGTGRLLLSLFGWKDPGELPAFLAGVVIWLAVGFSVFALVYRT